VCPQVAKDLREDVTYSSHDRESLYSYSASRAVAEIKRLDSGPR